MLIPIRTLDDIAAGRVDLAFRRWARPAVKVGGSQRTSMGVVRFDAVDPVELADVTDDEARRAGFLDRAALASELARHRDGQLYRIRLHREGDDPRIALREDTELSDGDVDTITARLDRLDRASSHGAWARATLALIRERPATRAPDLAASVGRETQPFKLDVRKLKNLGLTMSLRVGYELSPRGRAYLDRTERET